MRQMHLGLVAATLALVAPPAASALAQPAETFKQMTIVVGFSPGGGYDAYARVLARHMSPHLPGKPNVIVQNMPGGSSLKAVQYLDINAPKDGTVMTAFNPGLITESLLSPEKIRMKFSDVAWVGSITPDLRACYAWHSTGIKTWPDLMKAEQFNMGAPAAGTSTYINAAILKNLFGIKIRQVTGYPGSAEERIAIERGELDGGCGAWSSNPPNWIIDHKINPIVKFSPGPVPNLPDSVPFAGDLTKTPEDRDVLNLLTAADAVGRPYVVSKKVPAERLAALRQAFGATTRDAGFLTEAQKLDLPVDPMDGAQAERLMTSFYEAPPALVERAKDLTK